MLLEVRGLGRRPDIKPASLEVHAGEIVGIGGLVGAGRTELLRLIYGLDSADEGEVVVDGKRLPGGHPAAAIAAGLGLAPEDRKSQGLLLAWSLANNVTLADLGKYRRRGLLSPRAERKAAGELLRELKTKPDNPRALARELSGGNQQKVVLARWLMRQCKVLLFDEPTRGVDVGAKAEIYRLITDLVEGRQGPTRRVVRAARADRAVHAHPGHARGRARRRCPGRARRPSSSCYATPSPIPSPSRRRSNDHRPRDRRPDSSRSACPAATSNSRSTRSWAS